MIQRLFIAMIALAAAGCGVFGNKHNGMKAKEDIVRASNGGRIEIIDNVNSELWRLHPALNYLKGEVGHMAMADGLYLGGDTVLLADARLFWDEIETEYMIYEPSKKVLVAIDSVLRAMKAEMVGRPCRIDLLMVGGNWCSDTRMGLPRLCKVLDQLMISTEGNVVLDRENLEYAGVAIHLDYRRVNRDKKLIDGALAGDIFFGGKSIVIGRVPELALSKTSKMANRGGGIPDVDFAAETKYMGSILETPQVSWEQDLLELIRK